MQGVVQPTILQYLSVILVCYIIDACGDREHRTFFHISTILYETCCMALIGDWRIGLSSKKLSQLAEVETVVLTFSKPLHYHSRVSKVMTRVWQKIKI